MGSADAGTLHTVSICSRAAATAADSKDSASFFTDHMLAPHAQAEALSDYRTVRAECYGCSTKVDNHRLTTMPPCYELTTLLRRTLTYALGRSGRARREKHGQLKDSTL